MSLFVEGGYFMWLIALVSFVSFGFAGRALLDLRGQRPIAVATTHVDAVLFWGAFALAAGFLGTVVGLYQMARAIESAGAVGASVAWGGFRLTLLTTQAGLLAFLISLLLWFSLWYALRRRSAA